MPRVKLHLILVILISFSLLLSVYFITTLKSGKPLTEDDVVKKLTQLHKMPHPANINDLLAITQSANHLHKQRQWESVINTNIKAKKEEPEIKSEFIPVHLTKFVHLDLKGAPLLVSFYEKLFEYFKKLGLQGILLEYEDMFPYKENIHATNAYSLLDIKRIVELAEINHLEIIPLIQTFGHMEFVLKLEQYKHLREVPRYMQSICPSQNKSFELITTMIDQIIQAHPSIRYLHIGCDEVEHVGMCPVCRKALDLNNWSTGDLYLEHVIRIAKYIKDMYKIQPIIWDDKLRQFDITLLETYQIGDYVQPMIWNYNLVFTFSEEMWANYERVFKQIWVAGSFKGATGSKQFYTNIDFYLGNQKQWLQTIKDKPKFKYEGYVLTGWQRYNHFSVLCELLPSSMPSLATNIYYLQKQLVRKKAIKKLLNCTDNWSLDEDSPDIVCGFPGAKVYMGIIRLKLLNQELKNFYESSIMQGWADGYNLRHNYSSVHLLEQSLDRLENLRIQCLLLNSYIRNAMVTVYDNHTINEWLEVYLWPNLKTLNSLRVELTNKISIDTFPRRPLKEVINASSIYH